MVLTIQDLLRIDLARSKITPEDVLARPLDNMERAATNTPNNTQGYVLPYFDIRGRPIPFYRVRLFDSDVKYRQPKETPNHVYFPRHLQHSFNQRHKDLAPYIILTEGEKKAASATKAGFSTAAFGGVDSWRNRTLILPASTDFKTRGDTHLLAKIQTGQVSEDETTNVAEGFQNVVDYILQHDLQVIIIYDSDGIIGTTFDVQRAAAALGFELRYRGIPFSHIRQLILPPVEYPDKRPPKISLDDFLYHRPTSEFHDLLLNTLQKRSAFPRHPNIRDFVNRRLSRPKLSRKEQQQVSLAILSDLDSNGIRLRSPYDTTFFFDYPSKRLLSSQFINGKDSFYDSPFTQFMYKKFGISSADSRIFQWIGSQFTGEDPIDNVSPYRVFARTSINADEVIFQLSDSEYVHITGDPEDGISADLPGLRIHPNGDNNILFEAEQVEALNTDLLLSEYSKQSKQMLQNHWDKVLASVRLRDHNQPRVAAALLYYLSPWIHRWRNTQLPIELIIGEAGSGKSSLCELRLQILTGRPYLRNAPRDLKDWHASVSSTGGLHVTDNVQLIDRTLRQTLSDELCRITTEPSPCIEQRKYYTNAQLIRIPVRSTFAITAIQQPFQNVDLLQRALILELDRNAQPDTPTTYDSEWANHQIQMLGSREAWVAHHLHVLHLFFKAVKTKWNTKYQAKHRLINFEQAMTLMATIFGQQTDWIPKYLIGATEKAMADADWALEGLITYAKVHRNSTAAKQHHSVTDISGWAQINEEFQGCEILINPRKLGRWFTAHKSMIVQQAGLVEVGSQNNRTLFRIAATRK